MTQQLSGATLLVLAQQTFISNVNTINIQNTSFPLLVYLHQDQVDKFFEKKRTTLNIPISGFHKKKSKPVFLPLSSHTTNLPSSSTCDFHSPSSSLVTLMNALVNTPGSSTCPKGGPDGQSSGDAVTTENICVNVNTKAITPDDDEEEQQQEQ